MNTHILNKMRNSEVEDYLNRGRDTIFIPVGTVELHGDLPLDCEAIYVEAIAERMAEATAAEKAAVLLKNGMLLPQKGNKC